MKTIEVAPVRERFLLQQARVVAPYRMGFEEDVSETDEMMVPDGRWPTSRSGMKQSGCPGYNPEDVQELSHLGYELKHFMRTSRIDRSFMKAESDHRLITPKESLGSLPALRSPARTIAEV